MGKHNDKAFQEKIKMTFRNNLEKQFRNGLAQGMFAACKVMYDRITDESKSAEEKINAVLEFCGPIARSKDAKEPAAPKVVD